MNLSKTAKRFLSSTMAIALAGGSVLAFGSLSFAAPPETEADSNSLTFSGTVELECAVETASTAQTYTPTTATVANEDRATGLNATTTVGYDCNSDTVDIQVSSATSSYNGGTVPDHATDLIPTHSWEWGNGTTASNSFTPDDSGDADLSLGEATDSNGDVTVAIESIWTKNASGEELLAGAYSAGLTLTVTAK
jgi:hypothetical protein